MALIDPPELRRLRDAMGALPNCPHGCGNQSVYLTPTFRTPTADDPIDAQVAEIVTRYEREADGQMQRHLAEDHRVLAGVGAVLANFLAPPASDGPPYTHLFRPARCEECATAGDPECRDGRLYRDGGEELDYVDVYVGRCAHACHQPRPSFTITEVGR
jgi:hypothetical protein